MSRKNGWCGLVDLLNKKTDDVWILNKEALQFMKYDDFLLIVIHRDTAKLTGVRDGYKRTYTLPKQTIQYWTAMSPETSNAVEQMFEHLEIIERHGRCSFTMDMKRVNAFITDPVSYMKEYPDYKKYRSRRIVK